MKICLYFEKVTEENASQEFRWKNIGETRNYLTREINRNEWISKKHKKDSKTLYDIEHFLILGCTITGYVSISAFTELRLKKSNRNYNYKKVLQ